MADRASLAYRQCGGTERIRVSDHPPRPGRRVGALVTHASLAARPGERRRSGLDVLLRALEAVQAYAATHDGWAPSKERTLADGWYTAPPPSAVLDDWLARMEQRFPDWEASAVGHWDYSPDSITTLVALALRVTPTGQALRDPANADFVDGASYYLGEVLRRGCPSRWVYIDFKDEGDPITANFKLQLNDDEGFTTPFHLLSLAVKDGEPGPTRAYYDTWVG
jgi:hypothetical protein